MFPSGKTAKSCGTRTNKDCILMDEVDGMAGNEDRGGIQVRHLVGGFDSNIHPYTHHTPIRRY